MGTTTTATPTMNPTTTTTATPTMNPTTWATTTWAPTMNPSLAPTTTTTEAVVDSDCLTLTTTEDQIECLQNRINYLEGYCASLSSSATNTCDGVLNDIGGILSS